MRRQAERPVVAVVGAGLAGTALACLLARRGHRVVVYERRTEPDVGRPERGRGINLTLSERALTALRRIGLEAEVLAESVPVRGRVVHPVTGPAIYQPYSSDTGLTLQSLRRERLSDVLLAALRREPNAEIRFAHTLVGLDAASGHMRFDTSAGTIVNGADVIVGADGACSAVRAALRAAGVRDDIEKIEHRYTELTLPAANGGFALDPTALHLWPRGDSMVMALPNTDRSFTCTLFCPAEAFKTLDSPAAVEEHFARHYPDLPALAPDLVEELLAHPTTALGTVRCSSWQVAGNVVLIGDAAHGMLPFLGQGPNCALEDVVELDDCLTAASGDWPTALTSFERRRKPDADAVAAMSAEHFTELLDTVQGHGFQLRMRVERLLERALFGFYQTRHQLVSFSRVPYADVGPRLRRQYATVAVAALLLTAIAGRLLRR